MRVLSAIVFVSLLGAPVASHPVSYLDPIHVPILRHGSVGSARAADLPKIITATKRRYRSATANVKGSGGAYVPLTDDFNDISYSGVMSIGTPAKELSVVLDTGSSDLWVATTGCSTYTSDVPLFDPSKSSSYQNLSSPLEIQYGSGDVTGHASEETVTFGGYTLENQSFLAVDVTATDMLGDGLSGIMGLGFQSISVLQRPPFWQALYDQQRLPQPVFGLYLERHADDHVSTAPGGTLTLGGTNASLHAGSIEFIDMPNGTLPGHWLQQVQTVTVQGTVIDIPGDTGLAAIDTGTTLIGAPAAIAQQIWATIPGSVPLTGQHDGVYAFPCTTRVNVTLSFGGTTWAIDPSDMNFSTVDGVLPESSTPMCIGGMFGMPDVGSTSWVIGDVFLKNVYTAFQADPPAVGFAPLASGVQASVTSSTPRACGMRFSMASSVVLILFMSIIII